MLTGVLVDGGWRADCQAGWRWLVCWLMLAVQLAVAVCQAGWCWLVCWLVLAGVLAGAVRLTGAGWRAG